MLMADTAVLRHLSHDNGVVASESDNSNSVPRNSTPAVGSRTNQISHRAMRISSRLGVIANARLAARVGQRRALSPRGIEEEDNRHDTFYRSVRGGYRVFVRDRRHGSGNKDDD